jgi:hypothetical protein
MPVEVPKTTSMRGVRQVVCPRIVVGLHGTRQNGQEIVLACCECDFASVFFTLSSKGGRAMPLFITDLFTHTVREIIRLITELSLL